jgi:hypothetical protein
MSKTVVVTAGVLLAAGALVAVAEPELLDDMISGVGQTRHHITQAVSGSDDEAAAPRQHRRGSRQAGARSDANTADAGDGEDGKRQHEGRGKGAWRKQAAVAETKLPQEDIGRSSKEQAARQDDNDEDADVAAPKGGRRVAENDQGQERWDSRRRGGFVPEGRGDDAFRRMDRNGDGAIDASEFVMADAERIAARTRQFFKRFDADGDGKVTREEFMRGTRERLTALDTDDDTTADNGSQATRSRGVAK